MSAQLSELEDLVDKAAVRLRNANAAEDAARSEAVAALNVYNERTRALDAYLAERRKESPRGTDWSRKAHGPGRPA